MFHIQGKLKDYGLIQIVKYKVHLKTGKKQELGYIIGKKDS